MSFHVPNKHRVLTGPLASDQADGNNGMFFIPRKPGLAPFKVIASDGAMEEGGQAWEHVSVSLPDRCPTWAEMCTIKAIFWSDEDAVMELHPPRSDWVNNHQFCLHLWRPVGIDIPLPPSLMVGYKGLGVLA